MKIFHKNIPYLMARRKQWINWKLFNGSKIPCNASGKNINALSQANWKSLEEVLENAKGNIGIGFVLSIKDPFIAVDIDKCVKDRTPNEFAERVIKELNSYTEISISGTGIHIFIKAKRGDRHRKKSTENQIEFYSDNRFIAITGDLLND